MAGGWRDTPAGVLKKTLLRRVEPGHRDRHRLVARGLRLPRLPRVKGVWAISMVKNEADILESTVRHTFAQGIDRLFVVDNGSTDGTRELLERLAGEFPISIGDDSEVGYYQDHKMTALAHAARRHGAEWIVPIDADEFWFAPGMRVADYLRSRPRAETRTTATMYNLFPTPGNPSLTGLRDGPLRLDFRPHVLPKVATRPHPLLWIGMGNHSALRPGILRNGLFIAHLPWRSFEQYRSKVRQGARAFEATDLDEHLGGHWRKQGGRSDETLAATWQSLLEGRAEGDLGWRPVGPFASASISHWESWDPENLIPPMQHQLSEI